MSSGNAKPINTNASMIYSDFISGRQSWLIFWHTCNANKQIQCLYFPLNVLHKKDVLRGGGKIKNVLNCASKADLGFDSRGLTQLACLTVGPCVGCCSDRQIADPGQVNRTYEVCSVLVTVHKKI